jgi:hypothetical protein
MTIPNVEIATEQATNKPNFFNTTSLVVAEDAEHQPSVGEKKAATLKPEKAFNWPDLHELCSWRST